MICSYTCRLNTVQKKMIMFKKDDKLAHQKSNFKHLTLKKSLKRCFTEYILNIKFMILLT